MNPSESTTHGHAPFALPGEARALEELLRDVLSIVSHDLRTPLSVVHTTASMLLNPKYQLTPQQVREQHERMRRNVDLMNRMIGNLTDMVSLRRGAFQIVRAPLVIDEVLREAVAAHEPTARDKGLALAYDASPDVLTIDADRARLAQLLQILLGNAVKFCKAGASITVTRRVNDSRVQIGIADSGPGIAADEQPHIFDPYYLARQKQQKSATGLSLFIAKGIVDAHGGQIRCSSTPGGGATFDISLPLTI